MVRLILTSDVVHLNVVQDNADGDGAAPNFYYHPTCPQYDQIRVYDEETWQQFIRRARGRTHGMPRDDEEQAAAPRAGDKLWEIGCKVSNYLLLSETLFTRN